MARALSPWRYTALQFWIPTITLSSVYILIEELPSHLYVLLVSGEATPKQDERLHLFQKPLTTVIIARGNSSYRINRTGVYITEVVTQNFQGSIVLCQEQEVAILSV